MGANFELQRVEMYQNTLLGLILEERRREKDPIRTITQADEHNQANH